MTAASRSPLSPDPAASGVRPAPAALEAVGIVKRFPGVLANDHVDFELDRKSVV